MGLMRKHNILNLCGTFMYQDIELLKFKIKNGCAEYIEECNREEYRDLYPVDWLASKNEKVGYFELNMFFKNHVVRDGSQDVGEYLQSLQLDSYNLDEIVKRNNGADYATPYWVKFDGIGVQHYADFRNFVSPLIFDVQ